MIGGIGAGNASGCNTGAIRPGQPKGGRAGDGVQAGRAIAAPQPDFSPAGIIEDIGRSQLGPSAGLPGGTVGAKSTDRTFQAGTITQSGWALAGQPVERACTAVPLDPPANHQAVTPTRLGEGLKGKIALQIEQQLGVAVARAQHRAGVERQSRFGRTEGVIICKSLA